MKICHLSSEFTPLIKAGGLADVTYGLTRQFHKIGHFVRVILPLLSEWSDIDLHLVTDHFESTWNKKRCTCSIWKATFQGIELLFIDPHEAFYSFRDQPIYGNQNDQEKFVFFSFLAVTYLQFEKIKWDIIHCHEWVTSLAPLLLKAPTVLSIHNAAYQGIASLTLLQRFPFDNFKWSHPLNEKDHINLLKGGIVTASKIATVSPSYREELLTNEGGKNLAPFFRQRKTDFVGILNGIDYDFWNPSHDPFLPYHINVEKVSIHQFEQIQLWKRLHRQFLQNELGVDVKGPLLISIGRLVEQKSPELILETAKTILSRGGCFVLLGSTDDRKLEIRFKTELPLSPQCQLRFGFDERLSHLLYAAADLICIPSKFEPCGLTQMIGMRYGVIPIARKTGGLADTVFDVETSSAPESMQCGYTFDHDNPQGLHWGIDRAIQCYFENKSLWQRLVIRCMERDFSWNVPCASYLQLYESLSSVS